MKTSSESAVQQPLGRILSQLGRNYLRQLNTELSYLDIDRNYYALLLINEGKGNITQNELAAKLESDKVSMVRIIDYLTEKGYVNRIRSSSDKRKYCLTLTPKGIQAIPGIKEAIQKATTVALCGMEASQIAFFMQSLDIIKSNLKKANNTAL
ncbi:MAG: MarR family transcriptional regulator [Bacteroidetes bacterium]|nr:MarR family transcriptional regulator [Bacteroidota bacterium]